MNGYFETVTAYYCRQCQLYVFLLSFEINHIKVSGKRRHKKTSWSCSGGRLRGGRESILMAKQRTAGIGKGWSNISSKSKTPAVNEHELNQLIVKTLQKQRVKTYQTTKLPHISSPTSPTDPYNPMTATFQLDKGRVVRSARSHNGHFCHAATALRTTCLLDDAW